MLKGYEDRFVTLETSPRPRVKNEKTGWELVLKKTYPLSEQMNDYMFQNLSKKFEPTLVNISRSTMDPQRAQKLGLPYRTNRDRDAFRLKHGCTICVNSIGDKTQMQSKVWPPEVIEHFAQLAFVMNDRIGWYECENIKPDILEFFPVNWDESTYKKVVHS